MSLKMVERTDQVWKSQSLAATYLEGVRAAIPLALEQIDVMLRLIAACGRPVRRVLDLGCGDGVLACGNRGARAGGRSGAGGLLGANAGGRPEAILRHRRCGPLCAGRLRRPTWTEAVAEWSPYDAIVSGYSIHHQPDDRKRAVYGEIFGLLNPGGVFVNIEHVSSSTGWLRSLNHEMSIDSLRRHHPDQSRDEVARHYYDRPDKSANILAPVERQCAWLRDIGFTDVDCYLKVFEMAVFGGRRP